MSPSAFKIIPVCLFAYPAAVSLLNPALADNARHGKDEDGKSAIITVFAPGTDDVAGVGGRAFLVDIAVQFNGDLASTGVTPELTGPGLLANAGPFPGSFSVGANDDHFPGLVVLLSSTTLGPGPGQTWRTCSTSTP